MKTVREKGKKGKKFFLSSVFSTGNFDDGKKDEELSLMADSSVRYFLRKAYNSCANEQAQDLHGELEGRGKKVTKR